MEIILDALLDALIDTLKIVPFLYITYLLMEWLERYAGKKTTALVAKCGRFSPALGALLGVLPQCGFSAAGASLYAGRVITGGTLLAIFLSTSDEMLPLLVSAGAPLDRVGKILLIKVLFGLLVGFAFDGAVHFLRRGKVAEESHIGEICRSGHCHCEDHSPFLAALIHAGEITLTVFLVNLGLGLLFGFLGEDALSHVTNASPLLSAVLSALVGLIPNCASSVAITQLYLSGVLSAGSMLAGLLVGAGVGLLVLFRINRPLKDSLKITVTLFLVGVLAGTLFDLLHLGALLGI